MVYEHTAWPEWGHCIYIIDIHAIHVIVNLYVILCSHNEMGRATQEATVLV